MTDHLSNYNGRAIEQQLLATDIAPLQKQHIEFTPLMHLLIKWAQLICAHYKFWLHDLQESFVDGRAFLYIISYYLPSLCDYSRDIKHLTTLATCQTRDEHMEFNRELGQQSQPMIQTYERNVKANFRFVEECIKQFGTFSNDLIKYENYAKDLPDERCTMIVLAMLAHDLLFSNSTNGDASFRHQTIFDELKEKYSKDDEPLVETKLTKPEREQQCHVHETELIRENSIDASRRTENISTSTDSASMLDESLVAPHKTSEGNALRPSISSTTINIPIEDSATKIHPLPNIQSESSLSATNTDECIEEVDIMDEDTTKVTLLSSASPSSSPTSPSSPSVKADWSLVEPPACVYDQTLSDSLYASLETMFTYQTPVRPRSTLSQSVLHTMNHDILDHLETLPELRHETDDDDDEDSFNSARSGLTTMMDPRRTSMAGQTTSMSFHDLVELEKTIENDGLTNHPDNTSLFLIDETTPSEADSVEMNRLDEVSELS